jgi:hypothetical protein
MIFLDLLLKIKGESCGIVCHGFPEEKEGVVKGESCGIISTCFTIRLTQLLYPLNHLAVLRHVFIKI